MRDITPENPEGPSEPDAKFHPLSNRNSRFTENPYDIAISLYGETGRMMVWLDYNIRLYLTAHTDKTLPDMIGWINEHGVHPDLETILIELQFLGKKRESEEKSAEKKRFLKGEYRSSGGSFLELNILYSLLPPEIYLALAEKYSLHDFLPKYIKAAIKKEHETEMHGEHAA
jgi:hypothetical protein